MAEEITQIADIIHHKNIAAILLTTLNATLNNISVKSWWSVLLVEETGVPGENH